MYKVASDRRQTMLHRGRPADWVQGDEQATEHDRWRNLKLAIQNLDDRIQTLPKGSEARKKLGLQKLEWQQELRILGKKMKADKIDGNSVTQCFANIAREQLAPALFKAMWAGALRLHAEDTKKANELRERAQQIADGVDAEQTDSGRV